jgi:hypothetical protein
MVFGGRRLRRRCAALVRDLPMPAPFDARALCEQVAARRGRPITLVPMEGLAGVCGLWVATATADLIFYEQVTTPPHQEHIILHELGHLLCDHHRSPDALGLPVAELLPSLDPAMVQRVLGRAGYTSDEEREAELLASMIRERARAHGGGTLTDRLHGALEDEGDG